MLERFDGSEHRAFLSTEKSDGIYVADLNGTNEEPDLLARISDAGSLSTLEFHYQTNSLLASDDEKGVLYRVDPSMEPVLVAVLANNLGRPTSMAVDEARGIYYISNSLGRHLWSLRCGPGLVCQAPLRFAEGVAVSAQTAMMVSPDGALWIAELVAR